MSKLKETLHEQAETLTLLDIPDHSRTWTKGKFGPCNLITFEEIRFWYKCRKDETEWNEKDLFQLWERTVWFLPGDRLCVGFRWPRWITHYDGMSKRAQFIYGEGLARVKVSGKCKIFGKTTFVAQITCHFSLMSLCFTNVSVKRFKTFVVCVCVIWILSITHTKNSSNHAQQTIVYFASLIVVNLLS